ncbi:hypothetical protein TGGT1_216210 [Toxoplasma gondii GT1]|uniref:Uncharacterized protein n=7 Tax=Toxoplasma gondii TaxID=5811 RepID=S7W0K6_TOXGG|nr:hypothetical protein TGGT1_216210 [Toxoplasma gondii GT1]KAF4639864.1 hypothetical protein TGRH88_056360 [Toxoplasma gondii]PUA84397.1 down-regulated in metastasis protein [Toxoplasma gondii TgCATBr9]
MGNPREGGRGPAVPGGSLPACDERRKQQLEERRRVNLQTKCFDPTTTRFRFLSFAERLQIQLKAQTSPLRSTGLLDLLEEQKALLERTVGSVGWGKRSQPDTLFGDAEAEEERRKRRKTEELQFSSLREVIRHLATVQHPPAVAALLSELAPLCDSLPLLLFHRERILQSLLRLLLEDEAITVVLNLLQALAKDLRSEFVAFLPSVFSSLLLLSRQLELTVDAERLRLLFSCIGSIFRYLARPLLREFDFAVALFMPWLCGDDASPPSGGERSEAGEARGGRPEKRDGPGRAGRAENRQGAPAAKAKREGHKKETEETPEQMPSVSRKGQTVTEEIRLLAARAFACLLRKAGGEEGDSGDLLGCIETLFRHMSRCSLSAREAYGESVAMILFESVKSVQLSFKRPFDCVVRFLFATVLFQKPYVEAGERSWAPSLSAAFPSGNETDTQLEGETDIREADVAARGVEEGGQMAEDRESATEGKGIPKVEDAFAVYRAQVKCLVSFLLHARQHTKALESPGAKKIEALLLEFFSVAVKAAPSALLASLAKLGRSAADEETDVKHPANSMNLFSGSFASVLASPFHAYFYNFPAPHLFTDHMYLSGVDRTSPLSSCLSLALAASGKTGGSLPSSPASPLFLAYGLLTLIELSGAWVFELPRLEGSFDAFLCRLFTVLSPALLKSGGDKQKQKTKQDSRKKKSWEGSLWRVTATEEEAQEIERAPLVLQPLLATCVCLRRTPVAKEAQQGERSPRQGLSSTSLVASECLFLSSALQLEAVSFFSLFLPCAVLRLLSLLWRAVPLSFCSAVNAVWSSTSSDLFGGLLSVPLKFLQFSTARALPLASPAQPATLLSSSVFPVKSSPTCLLEAYVNCALAYTSMLHAHLAPFKEETLRRQNCVHGFGLYGLRSTCGFLLRLLASQPRQVALSSALPLQLRSHSPSLSGDMLEWERSAASLLLAEEMSEFVEASSSRLDASGVDSAQTQEKKGESNEGRLLLLQAKQSLPQLLLAVMRRLQKTRSAFEGSRDSAPPHSGRPTRFEVDLASAAQRRTVDDLACTYSMLSSFLPLLSATEIQAYVAGEGEDAGVTKSDQRREELQKLLALVHTETSHLIAVLLLWLAGKLLALPVDVHLAAQNVDTVLSRDCARPCACETADSDGALPTTFASVRSRGKVTREAETDVTAVLHILRICFRCLDTATPLIRGSSEAAEAAKDLEDTQGRRLRTRAGRLPAPPIELLQVVQEVEEKVKHTAALTREPRPSFCVFSLAACSAFSSSEKWLAVILSLFSSGSFLYELHGPSGSSAEPFVSLFSPLLRSAAFCISSVLGASFEEVDGEEEKTEVLESRSSSPQGSAYLRDVVGPHLASILSCCSSSCRRARQDAIFFLHLCSPFLCSLQSVFSSSCSVSAPSTHAALEEAISAPSLLPLHRAFADACGAQLRSLLSLEKLPVGLETERKLINAYGALVRGATSVFSQGLLLLSQPLDAAEESMATPEEARMCLDVSFTRTVAPILEATVRVLLSQLFVKFSPLWQPAVDAVLQLLEDIHALQGEALQAEASALTSAAFAAAVSSSSDSAVSLGEQRSSARSVTASREPTEGERETCASLEHEGCVARKTPSEAACASSSGEADSVASASVLRTEGAELSRMHARLSSALLSTTWEILTAQVARAVSDLGACRPGRRAAVPSCRKPEASLGRPEGETVEPDARGRAAEANCDVESQRYSAGVTEAGERQEGSEREANAFSKWFVRTEWKRALGDDADEVSDPLSRHTRLLRLVEGIMGSYGKDAFVTSKREEAAEPGVQESEEPGTEHACREENRSGTVEKTGGRESERRLVPGAESGDAKPVSGPGSEPLAHANKLKKAKKRVQEEARMSGSRAGGLSKRREALTRFNWLLRQTLCVVETLTEGGADNASGEEEGELREIREAPHEAAERSETPCVSSAPRGEGERLVTCEEAIFRTNAVSLVPRACDCLRAVVALSRVDSNCFLSAAEKRALALKSGEKSQQSPGGALGLAAGGKAGGKAGEGPDETDRLLKEAAESERLWTRLPAVCAQRLVTIADPSLQQLVIQVLQLSPVLRPQLAPYAPLLAQLISDKSSSNALLRLRLAEPEEEGEDDLATDDAQATTKRKNEQGKATVAKLVVVQEQHRHLVVPLVVRILMAKVQHRAAGRSATAVFAERRNVFAFLSSVAAQELPLLLSILLYPLVDVWLGPEASKAEEAFPAHDSSAVLPSLSVGAASSVPLSGFLKEQYLCAFVAAQLNASAAASDSGLSPPEGRKGELLSRRASAPASPAVLGECTVDGRSAGETLEMSAHAEKKAQRVLVRLAPCCLPPNVSSRLPGCCKTLQQLQDMLKRLLFPATPFLILFYRALLQNIVSTSVASSSSREIQGATREQDAGDLGSPGPSSAGRLGAGRDGRAYVKQTVHLCLLLLRQLLDLFPEASNVWRDILKPAGPALQHLLEAAVATAAASPAGGRGPHEEGKKQKKNIPAVVALVCSWAAQPAYFSFFSSVVPEALPTLFAVPALPAVLRRVAPSFGSEGPGRRAFGSVPFGRGRGGLGASCGVLEAVLDAALLLSVGGMDREREEALAASFHGEIKDLRRRRRKTRARGRHASQGSAKQIRRSAVSSSSSSSEEEKEMWVEEDEIAQRRQALLREQRELEAERQQHEREGMATLLPHVGGLLASLEILFQHRRLATLGGSQGATAPAFGSSQGASGDRKLEAAREDGDAGKAGDQVAQEEGPDHDEGGEEEPREREEDDASAGPQRSLFGVVRVKELQLLTRIARYAVADVNASSEQLGETPLSPTSPSKGRPKIEASASSLEASEAASTFAPVSCSAREQRFSVVLRLIRLLVQSLPSGSVAPTLNARLGSPSSTTRLLLSLEALLQLTFPLAAQVRALQEEEGATPGAASAEIGAQAGPFAGVVHEDAGRPGEASKASPSSQLLELKGVLEAMTRHCSILLQSTVSSACRAAVAKLFLAVEFAACGVMLFSSDTELDEKVGAQIERLLSRPQTGAQEEDEVGVEAKGQQLLAALVPGGSLLRALLTEREDQTDGGDARMEKKLLCSLLYRRCSIEERGSAYGETQPGSPRASPAGREATAPEAPVAFVDNPETLFQWRLSVALIVFSLNYRRGQTGLSRGQALTLLADDEDQPDSSMQLIVLHALVASATIRGLPSPNASPASNEIGQVPPGLLEPLIRHCLFLLGAAGIEWSVQQAAAAVLKAVVDSVALLSVAPASRVSSSTSSSCMSRQSPQVRMQLLARLVMPFVRAQLKAPDDAQLRQGLHLLAYVVRTLAPVALRLPSLAGPSGPETETKRLRQLDKVFHLDLASLLAAPPPGAVAEALLEPGTQKPGTEDAGGDFFRDFLHMQRHRQGRALQRLAQAAREKGVGATTLRLVALPLCFASLLQRASLRPRSEEERKKKHSFLRKEVFHQGLAEQAVSCLEACSYRLKWPMTLNAVRLLSRFLSDFPEREGFLFRAICGVVRAFEAHVKQAVSEALHRDSRVDGGDEGAQRERQTEGEESETEEEHEEEGQDEEEEEERGEGEEHEERAEEVSGSEDEDEGSRRREAAEGRLRARHRLELMHARIKADLLPLLYRLAFGSSSGKKPSEGGDQMLTSPPGTSQSRGAQKGKEQNVRPSIVAVLLLLIRLLPAADFQQNLPKLVRSVAFNLRSRDRDLRRKARGALVSMAVSLGPSFFSVLVAEVGVLLQDRKPSVKKGGAQEEDVAGSSAQAFYRPVFLFTVHAMLKGLVDEEEKKRGDAPGMEVEGDKTGHEEAGLDKALPLVLPLIAEELSRVADPDRLSQDPSTRQHSKIDEARHLKGPSLVFLLASCSSATSCASTILPFLYSLLGGRRRVGDTVSSAYSPAYLERVKDLFLHFVKGANKNRSLSPFFFFLLSRRLLTLTVALLQSQLLHPLQLEQAGRRREHLEFLLAKQELRRQQVGGGRRRKARANCLPLVRHAQLAEPLEDEAGACAEQAESQILQERMHAPQDDDREPQRHRTREALLREDAGFFHCMLFNSAVGLPGEADKEHWRRPSGEGDKEAHSEGEGEEGQAEANFLQAPDSLDEAMALARERRLDGLRAAVAAKKDRAMVTQPGAAKGISLEKALHKKSLNAYTRQGFDSTSRATTVGFTGLRLLLSALKRWKFLLKKAKPEESSDAKVGSKVEMKTKATQRQLRGELEKTTFALLICFCSNITDLISWTMRCLPHLLPLRLSALESRGAVVASMTLRLFHSMGGGWSSSRREEDHQLFLACSRLLPLLLLHPQGNMWFAAALNPYVRVPQTHRQLLLTEMERTRSRGRAAKHVGEERGENQGEESAASDGSSEVGEEDEQEQTDDAAGAGGSRRERCPAEAAEAVLGREKASEEEKCKAVEEPLVLSDTQMRLLREEEEKSWRGETDVETRLEENFKEALLAQILHSLESPQLRLSGLMLFKTLVLPHYRDVAAAVLASDAGEGKPEGEGGKRKKDKDAGGKKARKNIGDSTLLCDVYRGVDTIVRLMIQEAGEDAEGRRLAAVCGDIYSHFLLNFPMTEKTQQYRILFLIKNLHYSAPDGRRAVLNCLHKVLIRFPSELVVSRYSEVFLLALSGRLVLEEDRTAHEMLRMLLHLLLDIAQDSDDPEHSAASLFQTAVTVFLQPQIPKIMALQEFVLVFLDSQRERPMALLPRVLPLLHRMLLVAADRESRERFRASGVLPSCGDWRVSYKALLAFEKLMLFVHPSHLDGLFSRAARAAATRGETLFKVEGGEAGEEAEAAGVNSVDLELETQVAAQILGSCMLPSTGAVGGGDQDTSVHSRWRQQQGLDEQFDAHTLSKLPKKDLLVGAAVGRLWLEAVGEGLRHEHPWLRAVSLRCVGAYIAAKSPRSYRPSTPCLFYLHRSRVSKQFGLIVSDGAPARPGADVVLAALSPFCKDLFLEKNPAAVLSARALVLPLLQLALSRPDVVVVPPRRRLSRAQRGEENNEGAGDSEEAAEEPVSDTGDAASDDNEEETREQDEEIGEEIKDDGETRDGKLAPTDEVGEELDEEEALGKTRETLEDDDDEGGEEEGGEESAKVGEGKRRSSSGSDCEQSQDEAGDEQDNAEDLHSDDECSASGSDEELEEESKDSDEDDSEEEASRSEALAMQVLLRPPCDLAASTENALASSSSSASGFREDSSLDLLAFENKAAELACSADTIAFSGKRDLQPPSLSTQQEATSKRQRTGVSSSSSAALRSPASETGNSPAAFSEGLVVGPEGDRETQEQIEVTNGGTRPFVVQDEASHPLLFLVKRLNFWLRRHLGTLGAYRRARFKKGSHGGREGENGQKGEDICTSIVRVGAILSVFHALVYQLPLHPSRGLHFSPEFPLGASSKKRKRDRKDGRKGAETEADESSVHGGSLFFSEAHLERLLFFVIDAAYRCSTVIRGGEEGGHKKEARTDSLLLQLLSTERGEGAFAADGGSSLAALWQGLASLSPKEQQREVLTGGMFLLGEIQEVLKDGGREELALGLLAKVRTSVLSCRLKRKVDSQQQALLQPQKYAEKRRRQQCKKKLSKKRKVALLIAKNRGGKRREKS